MLPEFSKWLIDNIVTLQSGREVFHRHLLSEFPNKKYSVYLSFWFIHLDETVRIPLEGKEWITALFHHPLSPSHLQDIVTSLSQPGLDVSMCLVFPGLLLGLQLMPRHQQHWRSASLSLSSPFLTKKMVSQSTHSTPSPPFHLVLLLSLHSSNKRYQRSFLFSFPLCHVH